MVTSGECVCSDGPPALDGMEEALAEECFENDREQTEASVQGVRAFVQQICHDSQSALEGYIQVVTSCLVSPGSMTECVCDHAPLALDAVEECGAAYEPLAQEGRAVVERSCPGPPVGDPLP